MNKTVVFPGFNIIFIMNVTYIYLRPQSSSISDLSHFVKDLTATLGTFQPSTVQSQAHHVTFLILRFFLQDILQVESAATCATTPELAAETGVQI
jgi:hypothetical protein